MLFTMTTAAGAQKEIQLEGQRARTLAALIKAGSAGVTALECGSWALRLADYVHRLRHLGFEIETCKEAHEGGWHGRYVLRSPASVLVA